MPRRTAWIERPGTDGVITDLPAHQLPLRALERGADAIMPQGLVRQRRGWRYDGTTADVAANLLSVGRFKFVLAAATRTLTSTASEIYIHNPSSAGTALGAYAGTWLPRCVYNDELIFCEQGGTKGIIRFAGAVTAPGTMSGDSSWTVGEATLTGQTFTPAPVVGQFLMVDAGLNIGGPTWFKIVGVTSATSVTVAGAHASAGSIALIFYWNRYARAIPCVSIYEAGTINVGSANIITGFGTKFTEIPLNSVNYREIAFLVTPPTGDSKLAVTVTDPTSDTSWSGPKISTFSEKSTYQVLAPMPFKDVASHKDSIWGTGVKQHKSRVYVGPQGWDISFPPGFALPFDPISDLTSDNHRDFLMDFVDVPAPNDADECVAILPSENPLIVLKRRNAYGIYGVYGALDQAMLPGGEGAGCLDIRSAHTLSIGPVWGGSEDVWVYAGGRVRGLTAGKVTREWQQMAAAFDPATDRCVIGEKDGVLVVYLSVGNGGTKRCWYVYPFDEQGRFNPRWLGPISNHEPRYMFSSRVSGEADRILAVQDLDQGRVLDYGPAIDGTGPARDDDGTSPVLEMNGSARLAREAGADVDERLLEVAIEANLYDTGGSGSALGGLVSSKQALDSDAEIVTNLSSMASKNADLTKPYVHPVGVKAGLHQLRLTKTATQTTEQRTEITRIGLTLRRSKRPL